jgi:TonB-linked SusC/RagA family outer membrane protein
MRSFKIFAMSLLLALCGAMSLEAQNRALTGKVVDAQQQPVIGAAVVVKDAMTTGVVTDVDGTFTMNIPSGGTVVEVSCLGYVTKDVTIAASQSDVTITLEEDSMLLNETVVVGYGVQKKVNLTGAVTQVDSKSLENRSAHSVSNMLQGSVPGLNITTSAGSPGSTGSLNIRGYTSINGASPLVLIDGAIGDIDRVNPNDIESISVIKDAAAAAVYGARAAFGVILVTTKSGESEDGKSTVRYSGRWGWEEPTTSTDYETRGYWSVYTLNKFRMASNGSNYILYDDYDMQQLLARVNDKTENPARPWVVERTINGKRQWRYYGNNDWWHMLFRDHHPVQQHNISISGGNKNTKYFVSGGYDKETGIMKLSPDVFHKFNVRSKIDVKVNDWIRFSNNTSFYGSNYKFVAADGDVENTIAFSAAHALPIFPMKNPDGSYIYRFDGIFNGSYAVANGRHIVLDMGKAKNNRRRTDFTNTSEITMTPVKGLEIIGNFTYRFRQNRNTSRDVNFPYKQQYPDGEILYYDTGAGQDELNEGIATYNYYSGNLYGTYKITVAEDHNFALMLGGNYETQALKEIGASGQNLLSEELNDLDLVGTNSDGETVMEVSGGQSEYALLGFFGRFNYDYKGRYLFEAAGRYDGTSRFARGHRWGFFPSASFGWRVSEEPFFTPAKRYIDNLKLRFSYGSLGNQNVSNYISYRTISIYNFSAYNFGEGSTVAKYASISSPNSSDLTWEKAIHYNLGLDLNMFKNRLQFTAEAYIRDTKDMLTEGYALPSLYGATAPRQNTADLRTKGLEFSLEWKDQIMLAGRPFNYSIKGMLSTYDSEITKYDNPTKTFAKSYYEGMKLGEIWGFETDGLFQSDEDATEYSNQVDLSYVSGQLPGGTWKGGDLKYVDLDGDGKIGIGSNNVEDPGDRKILGNSLPRLQYGFTLSFNYMGFDVSAFFQGTGNHYWYPEYHSFAFWGPFSQPMTSYLPKNFIDDCWDYDNTDAYFPRAVAYYAYNGSGQLRRVNSRYLQNIRYLRFKNLSVGYSIPAGLTKKIGIENVRVYFTGENLAYWSPIKKHSKYIDPEGAINRSGSFNRAFYPWQKTYMFGVDITF